MKHILKILIDTSGNKYYVKDLQEDYHTKDGIIAKKDLKNKETTITSSKGKMFFLLDPQFSDLWLSLKRGPQVMIQKDIGLILAKTGVNGQSRCVDAGGGSGSLCLSLANVVKEVATYEINSENADIIQQNKEMFGFKNIEIKRVNIYSGIAEKNINLITLDLPEPWQVLPHAEKALLPGGHLVVYLPNLLQAKAFIDSCQKSKINVIETIELLERKWKIEEKILRPEFEMLGHTGFMIFCRKW